MIYFRRNVCLVTVDGGWTECLRTLRLVVSVKAVVNGSGVNMVYYNVLVCHNESKKLK